VDLLLRNNLDIGWREHCMLYIIFISIIVIIFFSLCLSVKLFLTQSKSFAFSFSLPSHQEWGGMREQLRGSLLPAEAKPQQWSINTTVVTWHLQLPLCLYPRRWWWWVHVCVKGTAARKLKSEHEADTENVNTSHWKCWFL